MSVYSEILRISGLRNRLVNKLVSLGLLSRSATNKLSDCTDAVEDIDEVTPYLISTSGIKNVAGYKYAQIDESAWVPAGTTPSGLVSKATGLGNTGILRTLPTNSQSIGTVYPPIGAQGMYADELFIDTDVIKPENIKKGVQILGVTGNYGVELAYGNPSVSVVNSREIQIQVDFTQESNIVYLNVHRVGNATYVNNTVLSVNHYRTGASSAVANALYIDASTGRYMYGALTTSLSNGILTITLPSGSDYIFTVGYACNYCYTD